MVKKKEKKRRKEREREGEGEIYKKRSGEEKKGGVGAGGDGPRVFLKISREREPILDTNRFVL